MEDGQKKYLLKLARQVIQTRKVIQINEKEVIAGLTESRGCFVTINKAHQLRGCIGYILPIKPLYQAVVENAYHCAFQDPRFSPVKPDEVELLEIEISVLTVPKELKYQSSEDLLSKLNPITDGVIISKGYQSATFLPQVWEQLPDKIDFLTHLCYKAGLRPDEWKDGNLKVELYQAEVFFESDK